MGTFWATFSLVKDFVDEVTSVWEKEIAYVVTLISFVKDLIFCVESVTFGEVSFFWGSGSVFYVTWIQIDFGLDDACLHS